MNPIIEITSIWEDEHLFEVQFFASNGKFSGVVDCYTLRSEIEEFAKLITGFPKSLNDEVEFTTGPNDTMSYFSVVFRCIDNKGHVNVRVKVNHIVTYSNLPKENYFSEFDISVDPASIDRFTASLHELSKCELGTVKAVLLGTT